MEETPPVEPAPELNLTNAVPVPVPPTIEIEEVLNKINYDRVAVKEGTINTQSINKRKINEAQATDEESSISLEERLSLSKLREAMAMIKRYFPKQYDETIGKRNVMKMSKSQLIEKVSELKTIIGTRSFSIITSWAKDILLRAGEKGLRFAGANVEGLAALCNEDEEFNDIWHELEIQYLTMWEIDPRIRLGLSFAKMAYMLHNQNKDFHQTKDKLDESYKPPSDDDNDESQNEESEDEISQTPNITHFEE